MSDVHQAGHAPPEDFCILVTGHSDRYGSAKHLKAAFELFLPGCSAPYVQALQQHGRVVVKRGAQEPLQADCLRMRGQGFSANVVHTSLLLPGDVVVGDGTGA